LLAIGREVGGSVRGWIEVWILFTNFRFGRMVATVKGFCGYAYTLHIKLPRGATGISTVINSIYQESKKYPTSSRNKPNS
jgi:hypothetical protein